MWEEKQVEELISCLNRCSFSNEQQDRWTWIKSPDRTYTTKEGYEQIFISKGVREDIQTNWLKLVWTKFAPQKVNAFVWRVVNNRIASLPNLKRRGILHSDADVNCRLCHAQVEESLEHLFIFCDFAKDVWCKLGGWLDIGVLASDNMIDIMKLFYDFTPTKGKDQRFAVWHGVLWQIWRTRNEYIFKGKSFQPTDIAEAVKSNMWL